MNRDKINFKVGDVVDYHSIIDGPVTSTGHTIQNINYIPSATDRVAWISGKAGCVALDALTYPKLDDNPPRTEKKDG